jgi:hypothetical protein
VSARAWFRSLDTTKETGAIGNGVKRNRLLRRKNNIPRPPRIIRAPNVAHVASRAALYALLLAGEWVGVGGLMVVLPFWITKKSMLRGVSSAVPL